MRVVSADPGLKGALVLWVDGSPVEYAVMPRREVIQGQDGRDWVSPSGLADVYGRWGIIDTTILELANPRPGEGVSSTFTSGFGYGVLFAVASQNSRSVEFVAPRRWTNAVHVIESDDPKVRSREAAGRLYPEFKTIPKRCRNPHEGVVDALLIGHWFLHCPKEKRKKR